MTPTRDPLALTPAELASEEEALDALAEVAILRALHPRARRRAALLASGHLVPGPWHYRLARRRLSLYSGRTCPGQGMRVVLRRGAELVRLPFA